MTYGEQLRHPNWQRLRLERLNAAGWKCEACGDAETTLHVHHRRYIKGRMAWEYPAENFAVLCDPCHSDAHAALDEHQALLALLDPWAQRMSTALLAGYFSDVLDPEAQGPFVETHVPAFNIGFTAGAFLLAGLTIPEITTLGSALRTPDFAADLRARLKAWDDDLQAEVARDLAQRHEKGQGRT